MYHMHCCIMKTFYYSIRNKEKCKHCTQVWILWVCSVSFYFPFFPALNPPSVPEGPWRRHLPTLAKPVEMESANSQNPNHRKTSPNCCPDSAKLPWQSSLSVCEHLRDCTNIPPFVCRWKTKKWFCIEIYCTELTKNTRHQREMGQGQNVDKIVSKSNSLVGLVKNSTIYPQEIGCRFCYPIDYFTNNCCQGDTNNPQMGLLTALTMFFTEEIIFVLQWLCLWFSF